MGEAPFIHAFQLPRAMQRLHDRHALTQLCQDAFLSVEVSLMHVTGMQVHV